MDDYKIIVEQEHQTLAAHYEVEPKPAEGYQSEAALEKSLIKAASGSGLRVCAGEERGRTAGEPSHNEKIIDTTKYSCTFLWSFRNNL